MGVGVCKCGVVLGGSPNPIFYKLKAIEKRKEVVKNYKLVKNSQKFITFL